MKILLVCESGLSPSTEVIKIHFGDKVTVSKDILSQLPQNYDYVLVVDSLETIKKTRANTTIATFVIALMSDDNDLANARRVGASAVFTKSVEVVKFIEDRGTPATRRISPSGHKVRKQLATH